MKGIIRIMVFACLAVCMAGCGKSSGGSSATVSPPAEQNLVIVLNPDPGGSIVTALSSSYAFKLIISSTPPPTGVKIDITGTKESDNSVQFSQTSQTPGSSVSTVDLALQNLVQGIVYVVKIEVTSQSTPTNKAIVTFKLFRK